MLNIILSDLRQQFGSKVLLSPEDLAEVIDVSVGQQANLRSANKFPIPHSKDDFGRVKVSIYDLANYLANLGKAQVKQEMAQIPDKLTRSQKKSTKGHLEKNWWLFHGTQIVSIIHKSALDFELNLNAAPKKTVSKI